MRRPKMTDIHEYHAHSGSIGLGRQSTAMALMACNGDLPKPDCFIFANPQWERQKSYETLDRLIPIAAQADIPFHIVSAGDIRKDALDPTRNEVDLPYYVDPSRFETVEGKRNLLTKDAKKSYRKEIRKQKTQHTLFKASQDEYITAALQVFDAKVESGEIADGYIDMDITTMGKRCSYKYKIQPIQKYLREHYDAHFKTPVGMWIGISTDEWTRMATSESKAFVLFHPLFDYGMSADDCKAYIADKGFPVPVKSCCVGCPLHSDPTWGDLTEDEIAEADAFEASVNELIENHPVLQDKPYFANGVGLHRTMKRIGTRPFTKTNSDEETERDTLCGAGGCFL